MDGTEKFLNQKRARRDQAKAARRGWCAQIPGLKETAERVIHFWNEEEGIKGIYVRATEDTLSIRFEQRAVGTGGRYPDAIQNGAQADFYFDNESLAVVADRIPFSAAESASERFVAPVVRLGEESFCKAIDEFITWAAFGAGSGGIKLAGR